MGIIARGFARIAARAVAWIFTASMLFGINVARALAIRPLLGDTATCATCGTEIALLGLWECHCGYAFYGWYWSRCEACGDLPPFVECPQCGASTKSPLLFG